MKEVSNYVLYTNLICPNWRAFSIQCEQFSVNKFLEMFQFSGFNVWWVDTYVNEVCLLLKLMLKWNHFLPSHVISTYVIGTPKLIFIFIFYMQIYSIFLSLSIPKEATHHILALHVPPYSTIWNIPLLPIVPHAIGNFPSYEPFP